MRQWIEQYHQTRAQASLPDRVKAGATRAVTVAKTALRERVRPPDVITQESVLAAMELPVERHLVEEIRSNEQAFREVGEWIGISNWRRVYDEANRYYDRFERRLIGNSRSDSVGGFKSVGVDGKKIILDLVRAHDSRHYPFIIPNAGERAKLVSFMGIDFVAATMFETRDGLGSRFSRLYAQMPQEADFVEMKLRDEQGQPLAINYVFGQLAEDGYSLPVGLTLYGIRDDDPLVYAARVLTLAKDPKDPRPDPRLAILSPKEDGDLVDALDAVKANNQRTGVKVKEVHLAVARNFFQPTEEKRDRFGKVLIPATHVIERDKFGNIMRVDGVKKSLPHLPYFPDSYYFIIDPVDGEVDEYIRKERNRLATASGRNNADNIGYVIGVDIVVRGRTAAGLELNPSQTIVSGQLAAVRSIPRELSYTF